MKAKKVVQTEFTLQSKAKRFSLIAHLPNYTTKKIGALLCVVVARHQKLVEYLKEEKHYEIDLKQIRETMLEKAIKY